MRSLAITCIVIRALQLECASEAGSRGPYFTAIGATPGISRASFVIRRSFVETIAELDVSIIFPFNGSASRRPLPSLSVDRQARGPLGEGSPASRVLRGAPTPGRPSRRASFPSRYGTGLPEGT